MSNIKVFAFSTGEKITNDNLFCVEILTTGNNLKLGKWVMPPSTDMKDILSEFPLDKNKNLKSFLKCCKQHVNCYSYRQEQYNNLKNILSDTVNCSLDANLGFTRIHLHMSGIEQIDPGEIYNIMLFMAYKSNEALPYLISIETQDNTLSPKMNKIFNKYFKPFKIFNLSAAFERIIDDNRHFIWKKVSKVSNNFDEYITEEKDEESISRDIESNDTKKVNSQSSLEQDLKELQIENGNSNYSSNSMKDKARPKSNNRRNKNKLVKENLDTIIKTQKINKQKKDLEKSSTNTVTKKKIKENISVNENKVQAALKDTFTKNNIDQSTKNEESREKKESKSSSITEDSVKNLQNPYKYFSSTPKLNKRKKKSEDVRLPEISAIASLSTNRGSNKNLTNILNEKDDNSLSTSDQDSEKEQLNEMQTSELLRDIKVASKTIKKKDARNIDQDGSNERK
ncbi:PREDICTED: putative uncharacterized protein DDB_G0289963 [Polistes canadensis]|uniref:putative uncharacterized protein DDB_G0289963 n=1 Tax=Polistes canadensis TaxID=91411 RepID=UPI000718E62C|nr:PREDICTED: putative uncharacterized protein DDB_G0289963 [Polistes canadensis]